MKAYVLDESELEFAYGARHIDPRVGVADYGPVDLGTPASPVGITIGIVGDAASISDLRRWLARCATGVPAKDSKYPRLFPLFPGINDHATFRCSVTITDDLCRAVPTRQLREACAEPGDVAVHEAVRLYLTEIEVLTENARVDVVLCVRPADLDDEEDESDVDESDEQTTTANTDVADFHDTLKARAMRYSVPLQVIRPSTWTGKAVGPRDGRRPQDEATRAWNLFTALYYKAYGTPWRMLRHSTDLATLNVGVSFFRTLDRRSLHTAVAQVFNERGDGMIVRGAKPALSKQGRQPYLERDDAQALLSDAVGRYRSEHRTTPARLVLHKTSRFDPDEQRGYEAALHDHNIEIAEMIWVSPSTDIRLFRDGELPPLRGTTLEVSDNEILLYTRGTVPAYGTYPAMYVPRPLSLRPVLADSSLRDIAAETLALSKMNWNQTQLDGFWPITLRTARSVGHILRHLPPDGPTASRYAYYM